MSRCPSWSRGLWLPASFGLLALACIVQAAPAASGRATAHSFQLPLTFEINEGQTDAQVEFLARGPGYNVFLTASEAVLTFPRAPAGSAQRSVVRMRLIGSSGNSRVRGLDVQPGRVNYFRESDAKRWQTQVRTYQRVEYSAVYPGIDLVYYGQRHQLEYDFIVAPGADPGIIRIAFAGSEQTAVDARGDLVLSTAGGLLRFQKPVIYQIDEGRRQSIQGTYVQRGPHEIGFRVAAFDRRRPLIIDPVLNYSTFLGGSGVEEGNGIAVDATGAVYVSGTTSSTDFPTMNPMQPASGAGGFEDIYVAKFAPDGSTLIYATYLGGSSDDIEADIAVDSAGAAYVSALSYSRDFPMVNALQPVSRGGPGGTTDAVVAKLSPDGSRLIYSTYLGGNSNESTAAIAVDPAGAAYVAGTTTSEDFPAVNPLQPRPGTENGANENVYMAKIAPDGSALVYSTYLGGTQVDAASDIAVDSAGAAYVTGTTTSPDFPSVNPFQARGGDWDAFVAKLAPDGASLVFSTYLGGASYDESFGIAIDASGATYVTGSTVSHDFPTRNSLQAEHCGDPRYQSFDAFVVKLAPEGNVMVYGTYLGGDGFDRAYRIAVDSAGAAHVTGLTEAYDFPTKKPLQAALSGTRDAFVSKLSPSGSALAYSTFLGGSAEDGVRTRPGFWALGSSMAIAADSLGATYVAGYTQSHDFPTSNALQPTYAGGDGDTFVVKISPDVYLGIFNDLDGAFLPADGGVKRAGGRDVYTEARRYLTTPRSDYLLSDWSYEVTVRSPNDGPPDILYIGIGSGRPDPTYFNEAANSLMFRIHQGWTDGRVDVAAHPTGPRFDYFAEAIGNLLPDSNVEFMEFTARITKVGSSIEFSLCRHPPNSRACEPEFVDEIPDISAAAPFLDGAGDTYLFAGNGSGSYIFTNAAISPWPAGDNIGGSARDADPAAASHDARGQRGGGAMDALLVALLASLAFAAAKRRHTRPRL